MTIKRQDELDGLEVVGKIVAATLAAMREAVRPGVSTSDLDAVAGRVFARHGARSAPQIVYGFPGVTCISVNDEIVHGIPGGRRLAPGDVVKLDVTAEKDGLMADAARTVVVAPCSTESAGLAACVREAFRRAVAVVRPGNPIRWIGREVEAVARRFGFLGRAGALGARHRAHDPRGAGGSELRRSALLRAPSGRSRAHDRADRVGGQGRLVPRRGRLDGADVRPEPLRALRGNARRDVERAEDSDGVEREVAGETLAAAHGSCPGGQGEPLLPLTRLHTPDRGLSGKRT